MNVMDGIKRLNQVFPQLKLRVKVDLLKDANMELANRLHKLAESGSSTREALIQQADNLGLWVSPNGEVYIKR